MPGFSARPTAGCSTVERLTQKTSSYRRERDSDPRYWVFIQYSRLAGVPLNPLAHPSRRWERDSNSRSFRSPRFERGAISRSAIPPQRSELFSCQTPSTQRHTSRINRQQDSCALRTTGPISSPPTYRPARRSKRARKKPPAFRWL